MKDRIGPALGAYVFGVLGVFLVLAPWTEVWERSTFVLAGTPAGAWLRSGFTRGLVTGIGILDLVVAFQEGAELWRRMRSGDGGEPR